MKEKILMDLGLSQNETKIYISLLETGFASPTKIAAASGIHRVNVYDSLTKLKEKGLVGEVTHEGKKSYQASPPENLHNIIKEKEIMLNKILPELQLANSLTKNEYHVQVFEGWDYIRNHFLHCLELKKDILALNVPVFAITKVGQYFQEVIHKRRAEQKQCMYHIYSKEALERIKFLNTLPYTKARYLEREHENNVTTTICDGEIAIHIMFDKEEQKPLTILIKNKQIAEAYRLNFFSLWDKAIIPSAK